MTDASEEWLLCQDVVVSMNNPYGGETPRNSVPGGASGASSGGYPRSGGYPGSGATPSGGYPGHGGYPGQSGHPVPAPAPGGRRQGGWPPSPAPESPEPPSPALPVAAQPPVVVLVAALVLALAGIGVTAATWGVPLTLLGWFLAGPLAIGVITLYSMIDTARRAAPLYGGAAWTRPAQIVVTVLIVAGVLLSSVSIAMWVGRI